MNVVATIHAAIRRWLPLVAVLIATVTARLTVTGYLREML